MKVSLALVAVLSWVASASAITIDTVPIGNPGNPADVRYAESNHPNGIGFVAQSFNIGKTEVTNAQYVAFLNAVAASDPYGLFNTGMESDTRGGIVRGGTSGNFTYAIKPPALSGIYSYENKPATFVTSLSAMRFTNWLHNGQPTGIEGTSTTEDGAYNLNGALSIETLPGLTRNVGARWWLPSENEWYKAAYFDPTTGVYYDYPTRTNNVPNNNLPALDSGNSINTQDNDYATGNINFPLTDAGAYTLSKSPYGTYEQGGNVAEWTDTLLDGPYRVIRGGSWLDGFELARAPWFFILYFPSEANDQAGFRVATSQIAGDFNSDGKVNAADYVLWRKNIGSEANYNSWRANFGAGTSASGTSLQVSDVVPEPSSMALILGVVALLASLMRVR